MFLIYYITYIIQIVSRTVDNVTSSNSLTDYLISLLDKSLTFCGDQ